MEPIEKTEKLDKVDLQILRTLQGNARLTIKELAQQVNLSSTPVFERLKRMESRGYIQKYIAVLNAAKLNQGFVVFCNVKMRQLNRDIAAEFTKIVQGIPGSDRMLQYQRQLRLPAENPRPRYEILPGVCAQCAWNGGESCIGRKRIRNGRAEARIRHTHLKSTLILNVWRELPADGCDSHASCSSGRYNGGRNCASLFFSGISPNHG